jgi:cytochrome c556
MKVGFQTIVMLGLASLLPSCNGSGNHEGESRHTETPSAVAPTPAPESPQQHWVQNKQLSDLMKTISARMLTDAPDELSRPRSDQRPEDVERAMKSAAKLAKGLADSAQRIPAQVENVKMNEADRAGFMAEAETLRKQAIELGKAADARQTDEMQRKLNAISSTCISCHSRYRDFAGQLDTQRASAAGTSDHTLQGQPCRP